MKKYLFALLTLTPIYAMADGFDLPIVRSIKIGNQCQITFNDKIISKHNCEYEFPSYLTSYSLLPDSWTGVWIFQDSPMGNACEGGSIRIVSIDSKNKIETYKPIDYCYGKLIINNDSEQVELKILDDLDAKKNEEWQFKDGKLIRSK
ncbi:hypothetical protein ABW286_22930 [Erwinia papayae]|uniref:Uncharacterized protein n=1 Tax=Erwinia papayae TaxID=206499 RepID=A0ABV3N825_9GAMM